MMYFEDYAPLDLLNARVAIKANAIEGTLKGYAVYVDRDDHAFVSYVNDSGTVVNDWFPVADLDIVEVAEVE